MSGLSIVLIIIGIVAMVLISRKRKPSPEEQAKAVQQEAAKTKLQSDTDIIYIFDTDFLLSNSGTTLMDKVFFDENVHIKKYIPSTVQAEIETAAANSDDENTANKAVVARDFIKKLPDGTLEECIIKNKKLQGEKAVIEAVKTILQSNKDHKVDYVYFCTENEQVYEDLSKLKKQLNTDKLVLIRDMTQFENIPYNSIVL